MSAETLRYQVVAIKLVLVVTIGMHTSWLLQFVLTTLVLVFPGRRFYQQGFPALLRLAPDMLAFTRQIQIASDAAKGCMARLAGQEIPAWEASEASLADLRARVRRTIDYVSSFTAAQVDGSESRPISVPRRNAEPLQFDGETFLKHYAMPNFYFHVTMTYALLRHAGVEVGKADYLRGAQPA